MPGLLISGPAGAGKTSAALEVLETSNVPALLIDFQSLYAALLGIERGADGRYPERQGRHSYALTSAEYLRRAAITGSLAREVFPIVTNSDGSPTGRRELLGLLGAGATEQIIDPGIQVVTERLSVNGVLSQQCADAINRYYGRLNG